MDGQDKARDKAIILEELLSEIKGKCVAIDTNHKMMFFGDNFAKVHEEALKNPNYLFTIRVTSTGDYCRC